MAAAAAASDPTAVGTVVAVLAPALARGLERLGLTQDEQDDIRLAVTKRLLVDTPPKIAEFAGRGSLRHWLGTVGVREAIGRQRTAARRRTLLETAQAVAPADPELAFLKQHYRAEFSRAFGEAIEALSPTDRTVLRHRFVDALTLDQLAAACGVHRATAARWLANIRSQILERTRGALGARLGVDSTELDSVFRLIASNFEVSVRGLLAR